MCIEQRLHTLYYLFSIPVRSAANWSISEVEQSRRRPLLGPSPGWKRLLPPLVGAFFIIVKIGCGTDGSFYSTSEDSWSWLLIIYIHTRRCQVACEKMEMLSQLTGHWHCCCYCVLCNLSRIVCPHSVYLSTRCWHDTSHWISRKYLSYLELEEILLLLAAILCQQECSCIQIF